MVAAWAWGCSRALGPMAYGGAGWGQRGHLLCLAGRAVSGCGAVPHVVSVRLRGHTGRSYRGWGKTHVVAVLWCPANHLYKKKKKKKNAKCLCWGDRTLILLGPRAHMVMFSSFSTLHVHCWHLICPPQVAPQMVRLTLFNDSIGLVANQKACTRLTVRAKREGRCKSSTERCPAGVHSICNPEFLDVCWKSQHLCYCYSRKIRIMYCREVNHNFLYIIY